MHGEGMGGIVLEHDPDGVAHFRAQHRAEHPEMLPLRWARFQRGEGLVGVFAVEGLAVGPADAMRSALSEDFGVAHKRHAHHLIDAEWSVVPVHLVGSDVVGVNGVSSCALRVCGKGEAGKKPRPQADKTYASVPLN